KYKSKTIPKTLNPQWREQFDFHLYDEQGGYVDITVWDKDAGKKDDFMGRCTIDLSLLSKEHTHKLDLPLEEGEGVLVLLVTLTASAAVSISDLSINMLDDPHERHQIMQRYSLWRSFHNLKDVGVVQVKVIRAEGLMAADVTGHPEMNLSPLLAADPQTAPRQDRDRGEELCSDITWMITEWRSNWRVIG
ncbi:multiple C2 and transmembrane domain-containing protein 1 isoform X1, partial [Lates japonicus]